MNREQFAAWEIRLNTVELQAALKFFAKHDIGRNETPEIHELNHYCGNGFGGLWSILRAVEDGHKNLPDAMKEVDRTITEYFTDNRSIDDVREALERIFPDEDERAQADRHLQVLEESRETLRNSLQPTVRFYSSASRRI